MPRLTFESLSKAYEEAKRGKIEEATIVVYVKGYPDMFRHHWTLVDIETLKELRDEIRETKKYAKERLKSFAKGFTEKGWEKRYNEWKAKGLVVEKPDEVKEFEERKKKRPILKEISKEIGKIRKRRPRRVDEFEEDIADISENRKEFDKNLDKGIQNIKFEENVKGSWAIGKSKTTGPLTWYDEEGNRHRYIIFDRSVSHIYWVEGERRRVSMSKSTARDYYRKNRIG